MNKLNTVFPELPLHISPIDETVVIDSSGFHAGTFDTREEADVFVKLINTHEALVELLDLARDAIADNPNIGPCGLGLVVQIDELLERVKA
jgi:dsDNA-binding SOS-regulon protein